MNVFLSGELNETNIKRLCPSAKIIGEYRLDGYLEYYSSDGRAFIARGNGTVNGFICECYGADLWRLDQWKDVLSLRRIALEGVDCAAYFSITDDVPRYADADLENRPAAIDDFLALNSGHGSLRMADIHLLIPGYCIQKPVNAPRAVLGRMLQDCIQRANADEFSSDFLKDCVRYALGKIEIKRKDGGYQSAVLTLMCHKVTRLCVIDIFVPAVICSTHRILNKFCGDYLELRYGGREGKIGELCERIGVYQYGSRRSMVFTYEKPDEESLLNLLVNEARPMGKIMGSHFKNLIADNLAQYDTAEVYASEVTMVEMTDNIENDLFARIESQAVEIFFVEMLLLQDAAVGKMCDRVQAELAAERLNPLRKHASAALGELIDEAAYATDFTDYRQFYYPTVRVSAYKVAKAFGLNAIRRKYDRNKEYLEQMIKDHDFEINRKENAIKNGLLIVLTLLSGIKTICDVFNIFADSLDYKIIFYIAMAIIALGVLLYFGIRRLVRRQTLKNARAKLAARQWSDEL